MKTAFAKDIPFIKKSGAAKSPHFYQDKLLAFLGDRATFNGFILPWEGVHTKCSVTINETGHTINSSSIHTILTGKLTGKNSKNNREKLTEEARELLKGTGQVFQEWKEFNTKDTKTSIMIVRCEECGELSERMVESLRVSRRRGSFIFTTCPNCRKALFDNRMHEKYKHLPHYLYILKIGDDYIKVGCTFRDVEKRAKEIQSTCKHKVTIFKSFKFETGHEAYAIESDVLNEYGYASHSTPRKEMIHGQTETFPRSYLRRISRRVNRLINKPLSLWEVFTPSYIDSMVEGESPVPEHYRGAIEDIRKSIDEYGVDLTPVV
ncbi:GIY-YIG nuclease family protein [Salmonella enterica]|nr:GIY-YIG nuclease family protein [Salmonella enterica]EDD4939530.1 hypothetical protein [Salmonella enterica subsp. enterica serovar Typhimurium]EAR1689193.1 GIY-YIG nuclease family protein [Salmonella enterica]EAT4181246.1 GIY-YIG nuclease family protein [Salmonella enterica]EBB1528227.1 GIY-YIG nuclease family protein [Salmonella enterica]